MWDKSKQSYLKGFMKEPHLKKKLKEVKNNIKYLSMVCTQY